MVLEEIPKLIFLIGVIGAAMACARSFQDQSHLKFKNVSERNWPCLKIS